MKINIQIKPNSKKGPLVETRPDGALIIYVREVAVDGRANEELIKILAKHYDIPKTRIKILRGATSRRKLIEIN